MNFEDLVFNYDIMITRARVNFDNGYGASVVTGPGVYSDSEHPYELAVIFNNSVCYDTDITDDVIGHLNEEEVTELLNRIEALPKREK